MKVKVQPIEIHQQQYQPDPTRGGLPAFGNKPVPAIMDEPSNPPMQDSMQPANLDFSSREMRAVIADCADDDANTGGVKTSLRGRDGRGFGRKCACGRHLPNPCLRHVLKGSCSPNSSSQTISGRRCQGKARGHSGTVDGGGDKSPGHATAS